MSDRPNVEQTMRRIEEIAKKLERGDLPLEESLALYEEATKSIRLCNELLDEVEQKVMMLTKNEAGTLAVVPFSDQDGGEKIE